MEATQERRLAAVMAADVVGYSRLMGANEIETHSRLQTHLNEFVTPTIGRCHGRVVKFTGDGLLAEFHSVVDAVSCAIDIQRGMPRREAQAPKNRRIIFRIGINLGDIIVEEGDIYGDGVNLASRLEGIAPPGGICVSDDVVRFAHGKTEANFVDFGLHHLKNIDRPIQTYVADVFKNGTCDSSQAAEDTPEVRYCMAKDGTNIAFAMVGSGPPLVKAASYMSHLDFENYSPFWSHWFRELSKGYSYVRYDERGNGLSDWDVDDISFDAFVDDLEVVVDELGLERFPLFGMSQGCAVSIAYACRHPERVSCLVLYGGYAVGWRLSPDEEWRKKRAALLELVPLFWGEDNPGFRQVFTSMFLPQGSREQLDWFNELQKVSVSPANAYRILQVFSEFDVRDLLPKVNVPTLVLHCNGDAVIPFDAGRMLAAGIPGSRFVPLDGMNHQILKEDACWPRFLSEVRGFLAQYSV